MDSTIARVHELSSPPRVSRPSIEALVEDYLTDCKARGLSPKTVTFSYGYPLRHVFLPWCACAGFGDLRQVSNRLLDQFTADLLLKGGKKGPLARQSVIPYIRTLNQFLAWASRAGLVEGLKARQPRAHRKLGFNCVLDAPDPSAHRAASV